MTAKEEKGEAERLSKGDNPDQRHLVNRITKVLGARGMTQKEFARKYLGGSLSHSHLNLIMRFRRRIYLDQAVAVEDALDRLEEEDPAG